MGGMTEWERDQFRGRWRRGEITVTQVMLHGTAEAAEECTLGKSGRRCIACAAWWRENKHMLHEKFCVHCGQRFHTNRSDARFCSPEHASRYRRGYRRRMRAS